MAERVYTPKSGSEPALINAPAQRTRFWELDFLRGICVLLMMVDHFFYSANYILGGYVWAWAGGEFWTGLQELAELYWINNVHSIAHYIVVAMFFVICGISCTLSHNNLFRGIKALALALVITMGTWLANKILKLDVLILFGVIHMLACAMLLFSLLDLIGWLLQSLIETKKKKIVAKWVRWMFPALCGVIGLIVFFALPLGHFGKYETFLYITAEDGTRHKVLFYYVRLFSDVTFGGGEGFRNFLSIFIDIKNSNFAGYTADYFPIFPYAFLVLIGSGIGRLVYHTRAKSYLAPLDGKWNKPVSFIGRNAIMFYLLHQLVIVAFFFAAGGFYSAMH